MKKSQYQEKEYKKPLQSTQKSSLLNGNKSVSANQ